MQDFFDTSHEKMEIEKEPMKGSLSGIRKLVTGGILQIILAGNDYKIFSTGTDAKCPII